MKTVNGHTAMHASGGANQVRKKGGKRVEERKEARFYCPNGGRRVGKLREKNPSLCALTPFFTHACVWTSDKRRKAVRTGRVGS